MAWACWSGRTDPPEDCFRGLYFALEEEGGWNALETVLFWKTGRPELFTAWL